jgi:flagellar basal body-associated protein FliL
MPITSSYSRKELIFLSVLSFILLLLVGGVVAVIVVETRHTTTVGNSVAYATPAPKPEDPGLRQQ